MIIEKESWVRLLCGSLMFTQQVAAVPCGRCHVQIGGDPGETRPLEYYWGIVPPGI